MHTVRYLQQGIAIIDPLKRYGEPGQYVTCAGDHPDLQKIIASARRQRHEIRYHYKNLAEGDEKLAAQVIVTEIPPNHVQLFHKHERLHEMTIVQKGSIIAIDSETLTRHDREEIREQGTEHFTGDMVIAGTGKRHTIMNPNPFWVSITTIQTARIPLNEFPHDWIKG